MPTLLDISTTKLTTESGVIHKHGTTGELRGFSPPPNFFHLAILKIQCFKDKNFIDFSDSRYHLLKLKLSMVIAKSDESSILRPD